MIANLKEEPQLQLINKDMSYGLMTHHGYRQYRNKTVMHSKQKDDQFEWDNNSSTQKIGTTTENIQTEGCESTRMSSRH